MEETEHKPGETAKAEHELAFVEYELTGFYTTKSGERKPLTEAQKKHHKDLQHTKRYETRMLIK